MATDKVLNIDEIVAAEDIEYKTVDAWGGKVRLASLSAADIVNYQELTKDQTLKGVRMLVMSLVDEKGERIALNEQGGPREEVVQKLAKKNQKTLTRLIGVVQEMNGLSRDKIEASKNASGEAQPDASHTA